MNSRKDTPEKTHERKKSLTMKERDVLLERALAKRITNKIK